MPIPTEILKAIIAGIYQENELDLDYEVNDEDCIKLAYALNKNSHIKKIDLSYQNVGDIGVTALANVTSIEEISLANDFEGVGATFNHVTAIGAEALANSNLKKLDISGNPIGSKGIKFFSFNTTIIELIALDCEIDGPGAAELIRENTTIKLLNLRNNPIKDEGLSTLSYNHTIECLYLDYCLITELGATYISKNDSLLKLFLSNNQIKDKGAQYLASHTRLEHLTLGRCGIGDLGAAAFKDNTKLKILILHYNEITSAGINEGLSNNKTITQINLTNNKLDASCLESLISMPSLIEVTAMCNNIGEEGIHIIKKGLSSSYKERSSVRKIDLMGNPMSKTFFTGFGKKRKAEEIEMPEELTVTKKPKLNISTSM